MGCIRYKGSKRGGMPVVFPIGCKSKSAMTHHKTAAPYLELTDKEADQLVELDPHNFAHASAADVAKHKKEQATRGKLKDGPVSCLSDDELEAELQARKRVKQQLAKLPKPKPAEGEGEEGEETAPAPAKKPAKKAPAAKATPVPKPRAARKPAPKKAPPPPVEDPPAEGEGEEGEQGQGEE